ncbi:MAG: DNA cytosine methyltransferase [Planctomycetes bacterium]|nr:DNA cytosine methyltransferase [Planctomycetota bacterium]
MSSAKAFICPPTWIRRKKWPKPPPVSGGTFSIVDLFCGCGGLTLGAWEAARANNRRLKVKLAIDTCGDALAVYRANFGVSKKTAREIDIREVFPGKLGSRPQAVELTAVRKAGKVDILVAGPPCQGHSDLNNHTRRKDPRNGLYLRVTRAVELLRPGIVLIENVGAVIHDHSNVVARSVEMMQSIGYTVATRIVRASTLGLPQRRKRHILLAVRGADWNVADAFPTDDQQPVPISDYLADIEDEPEHRTEMFRTPSRMTLRNRKRVEYLFKRDAYNLPNKHRPPCHENGHSYISMYGRLHWDQPAQTITTGFGSMGQGRFVHPTRQRVITPHEAARIQGFPDFFDFSGARTRRSLQDMIGNAVPPVVAAWVLALRFPRAQPE